MEYYSILNINDLSMHIFLFNSSALIKFNQKNISLLESLL